MKLLLILEEIHVFLKDFLSGQSLHFAAEIRALRAVKSATKFTVLPCYKSSKTPEFIKCVQCLFSALFFLIGNA